ncbi:MAG: PCRF domain-containing protein, partial [Clostridia bacterium]|nr:PCRF domain-containing protein [Clostridia bacterium]
MLELEQYAQDIEVIRKSLLAAGDALHIDHIKEQIDELTEEMNQPEFWNDTERSSKVNQKLGQLKNKVEHYEKLLSSADDIEVMMDLAKEENDQDMVDEVGQELQKLREAADALELETLMRGDYDDSPAILSLHAGAGGTEAQDWTQMLYRMYTRYCEKMGFTVKVLDYLD